MNPWVRELLSCRVTLRQNKLKIHGLKDSETQGPKNYHH